MTINLTDAEVLVMKFWGIQCNLSLYLLLGPISPTAVVSVGGPVYGTNKCFKNILILYEYVILKSYKLFVSRIDTRI